MKMPESTVVIGYAGGYAQMVIVRLLNHYEVRFNECNMDLNDWQKGRETEVFQNAKDAWDFVGKTLNYS